MAVAFPVGIGIALVWGVVLNYLDDPVGDALLLFSGVALVVGRILLSDFTYRYDSSRKKKRFHVDFFYLCPRAF